jgi:hypothetical protein
MSHRRRELIAELTDVYGQLDDLDPAAVRPAADGRDAVPVEASLQTRRA